MKVYTARRAGAYKPLKLILLTVAILAARNVVALQQPDSSDNDFLDMLEHKACDYFIHECGTNGLVQDRSSDTSLTSASAGGFQLTALCAAAERGWITRSDAAEKVLLLLKTYARLPCFHGIFAHYYDISSEKVVPLASPADDGADLYETAYLMAGVLTCRAYFNRDDPTEENIRQLATRLYNDVEWDWMLQDAEGNRRNTLARYWSPHNGFQLARRLRADIDLSSMLVYILALGSPSHPIPPQCWSQGWTRDYQWMGTPPSRFIACPPLYAHQYPHIWINLRGMKDRHTDYFHNSIRATRANRRYCLEQLYPGKNIWGLTSCDGPSGYSIYGYPPKLGETDREAVIAPTAAAGSLIFTPYAALSTLRVMYRDYRKKLWGRYGFHDAFSPRLDWYDADYLAVDQGPIALMVENFGSGLIQTSFMRNECVRTALDLAGFVGVVDDFENAPDVSPYALWQPSTAFSIRLDSRLKRAGRHSLKIESKTPFNGTDAITAFPQRHDFSSYSYVSLWIHGTDRLTVTIRDRRNNHSTLMEVGRVGENTGWQHVYYALPTDSPLDLTTIEKISFSPPADAHPSSTSFNLDEIILVNRLDTQPPEMVTGLHAVPSRMPGEVVISWDPAADDEPGGIPFRYDLRFSYRPIRSENDFVRALPVLPAPGGYLSGASTNIHFGGLRPGITCHFAIRAEDTSRNLSPVSPDVALTLPRTPPPPVFMVDDFDSPAELSPVAWTPSSPSLHLSRSDENALQGARSLKITFTKKSSQDRWLHFRGDLDFRDLTQYRYLTLWVYGKTTLLLKLSGGESRRFEVGTASSALEDGWSPIIFDLGKVPRNERQSISGILFFPRPGETNCSGTIFIDSLKLSNERSP